MAPVVVVAIVLTVLAYRTGQRTVNDLAGQNMRQIHERIEGHLNHLMDLPPAINQLIGSRLRRRVLALQRPADAAARPSFETLETFPDVSSIVLASEQGQVMWVIRYPGETTYEYAIKAEAGCADAGVRDGGGRAGSAPGRRCSSYAYDPFEPPVVPRGDRCRRPDLGQRLLLDPRRQGRDARRVVRRAVPRRAAARSSA